MKKTTKTIYWSGIEYIYNTNHSEYPKLKGGFVYVFFFTDDVRDFLKVVETDLRKLNMDIKKVEFVNTYDLNMEWESESESDRYKQIAKKAQTSKKVVFDDFYAYR